MNFFGFGHSKSSAANSQSNSINTTPAPTPTPPTSSSDNKQQLPVNTMYEAKTYASPVSNINNSANTNANTNTTAFPTEMLPHPPNPTISLSNNAFAIGTTIKGPDDALNKAVNQFDQPNNNFNYTQNTTNTNPPLLGTINNFTSSSNLTAQFSNSNNNATAASTTDPNNDFNSFHYNTVALPIDSMTTTSTTTNNLGQDDAGIPRGKLRISIIEANGLNVKSQHSNPYVVCTFENSEFVTHGPESFDNRKNTNNTHVNNTNSHNNTQNSIKPNQRAPLIRSQTSSQSNFNILKPNDKPLISNTNDNTNTNDTNTNNNNTNTNNNNNNNNNTNNNNCANPIWHHKAMFDVVGAKSELDISVYDSTEEDSFLGHVRFRPQTIQESSNEQWLTLKSRIDGELITGRIRVKLEYSKTVKRHYGPDDFEVLRLLGKGTFGQVFQVKKKDTSRVYAMKVLSKKVIVRKKEIAHTIGERDILVRTSSNESPFIVGLKFSFQTPNDLYLVTDYMSGGELFWHLQKEGRFSEDRAKFYIAELVLALEHLHDNDIVYRDLKPENILLDANGHIALCDFGLSKANLKSNGTTNTFCGTTEYLAPEVLLDETGYTKMVDFWSLGVLIFEMCCGWSPFYAENTQQMYKNIAFGKVRFPKEILSQEGRSFVKGLLNRNPKHRLGAINDARELRAHSFFNDIDWRLLREKKIPPPFIPHIANELDTSNFDPEFTNTSTSIINKQLLMGTTPLSQAVQENFKGFTYVDESMMFDHLSKRNNNSMNAFGSYRPGMIVGSLVLGNVNAPPEEEVIHDEEEEDEMDSENDNMDVDDDFVNGQFDL